MGVGWLLGRPFLLLTTIDPDGRPRRSVIRYGFAGGNFYAPADGGPWQTDLAARHTCTVQAYPGPKGVAARVIEDGPGRAEAMAVLRRERPRLAGRLGEPDPIYVFAPTGERVPEMLPPDLVWAWVPAVATVALARRAMRRS